MNIIEWKKESEKEEDNEFVIYGNLTGIETMKTSFVQHMRYMFVCCGSEAVEEFMLINVDQWTKESFLLRIKMKIEKWFLINVDSFFF